MVIGTGDLSELALGWATYNGDHMSMYAVNASVPKNSGAPSGKNTMQIPAAAICWKVHFLMCLIHLFLLSFYHLKTVRFHRRQRILWALMSCMTSSFTICCAAAMLPAKVYRLARIAFEGKYDDEFILKWLKNFYRRFCTAVQALMSAGWTKGRNSGGLTERRPKDAF